MVWDRKRPRYLGERVCLVKKVMAIAGKPANRAALPKAKWKILLVGDYPSSQKARAEILEKQGNKPAAADEYRAALSLAPTYEQAQNALKRVSQ